MKSCQARNPAPTQNQHKTRKRFDIAPGGSSRRRHRPEQQLITRLQGTGDDIAPTNRKASRRQRARDDISPSTKKPPARIQGTGDDLVADDRKPPAGDKPTTTSPQAAKNLPPKTRRRRHRLRQLKTTRRPSRDNLAPKTTGYPPPNHRRHHDRQPEPRPPPAPPRRRDDIETGSWRAASARVSTGKTQPVHRPPVIGNGITTGSNRPPPKHPRHRLPPETTTRLQSPGNGNASGEPKPPASDGVLDDLASRSR